MSDTPPDTTAATHDADAAAAAKPAKKGRWRKRLLWTVLLLLLLIGLSPLLLSLGPVRSYVADKVSDALGQKVEIGKAFAFWGHGIDLEDIRVANPEGFEGAFATVEKVHADVDVLGFVFGRGAATVKVDAPHVMLRSNGEARNLDAFMKEREGSGEAEASSSSEGPDIDLTVSRGVVEAIGFGGTGEQAPARIDAIDAHVALTAEKGLRANLGALFRQMQKGGGDARVEGGVEMDEGGKGPLRFQTPDLDLAKLAPIIEGFTGVVIRSGTLQIGADGRLESANDVQGTAEVRGDALAATLPDGATVELDTLRGRLAFNKEGDDTAARVKVQATGVAFRNAEGRVFREARIDLDGEGALSTSGVRVTKGRLQAGGALVASIEQPLQITTGPQLSAIGEVRLDADLGGLAALRDIDATLEKLQTGRVAVRARFNEGERLDVTMAMLVQDLAVALGDEAGSVYRDPRIVAQGRFRAISDEVSRFDLFALQSLAVETTGLSTKRPFTVQLDPEGVLLDGPIDVLVKLEPLSRALPATFGLERGESLGGTLTLKGQAKGTADAMDVRAALAGRGLTFPARMQVPGQNSLDATLAMARSAQGMTIDVSRIAGTGIDGKANATIVTADDSMRLDVAQVDLRIDLARARPLLGGPLGLEPGTTLAGLVTTKFDARPEAAGNGLKGTTTIQNLVWQGEPTSTPLRQANVTVNHDVLLASDAGASKARSLVMMLQGLRADLSGSEWTSTQGGTSVALRVALGGEASGLAPTLRSVLGPDYADLQGQGQIAGTITVTGPLANSGERLVAAGRLQFGTWTTSGVTAANSTLILERKQLPGHQVVMLRSTLNKGPTEIDLGITPGPAAMPWALRVKARGVDTGSMLTNQGPGRYMAYALPSLLPAKSNVPVLSGLLDLDANLTAADIASPKMADSLGGTATLAMRQGEIRNSTLFQTVGGGQGLGKGMELLLQAVPDIRQVVQGASRALVFTSLESKMRVGVRQVVVDALSLRGRYITLAMNGVARFNETLEMRSNLTFEGSAGERLKKLLPNRTIPMRVTGTFSKPRPIPDLDPSKLVGSGLLDKVKDKIPGIDGIKIPGLGR